MVLVKMLMEIDPLSMGGSLVMTMASISPSGREVPRRNRSTRGGVTWCPHDTRVRQAPQACPGGLWAAQPTFGAYLLVYKLF